ncbi:uncharacterized protein [Watersipora subatra]|uniref:uncharacterized protein n=1 Tax=Watersipora subatra TaxID=2589382 RepID=UPI00355B0CF1
MSFPREAFVAPVQTKPSPGVIGEGRKITKVLDSSLPQWPAASSLCTGSEQMRYTDNPRFQLAMQQVATQNSPYMTVPPTKAYSFRSVEPAQHLWSQTFCSTDDMPYQENGTQTPAQYCRAQLKEAETVNSDDDDEIPSPKFKTHPNKYPVQIECHGSKFCGYRRQQSRSGYKLLHLKGEGGDTQQIRYYKKDLVRVCKCGQQKSMDEFLLNGSGVETDGYEIHYSQKCKWKAYDDYKTGQRVLIRLCKCYEL